MRHLLLILCLGLLPSRARAEESEAGGAEEAAFETAVDEEPRNRIGARTLLLGAGVAYEHRFGSWASVEASLGASVPGMIIVTAAFQGHLGLGEGPLELYGGIGLLEGMIPVEEGGVLTSAYLPLGLDWAIAPPHHVGLEIDLWLALFTYEFQAGYRSFDDPWLLPIPAFSWEYAF